MPTTEVPLIPGICTSQTNLTLYWSQINLAFELIVNTAEEEQGIELTLPGIPPIPLAGMPSITIPKMEAAEIPLRLRRPPGVKGYVGNVYPVSQGGKGVGGKFGLPGFPGFSVEGIPPGMLPGVDPSTYTMEWLNKNYEIIATTLEEEGITFEPIVIPQVDICETIPGTTSPGAVLVTQLVNLNNQTIITALTAACVIGEFQPFTNFTQPGPVASGSVNWNVNTGGFISFTPTVNEFVLVTTAGNANVDNFEVSGGSGIFWDVNRQPTQCLGSGFTVTFSWSIGTSGGGLAVPAGTLDLYEVKSDNTLTHRGARTLGSSGSQNIGVSAGVYAADSTIGLDITMDHSAFIPPVTSTFTFRIDSLVLA